MQPRLKAGLSAALAAGCLLLLHAPLGHAQTGAKPAPSAEEQAKIDAKKIAQAKVWNVVPAPADPRDFSGVWWTVGYDRTFRQLDGSLPPMNATGLAARKHRLDMEEAGTPIADASTQCFPHGVPRLMASPYPIQIDYARNLIVILHETAHNIRFLHMHDEPAPPGTPVSFMGYSRAHWDGDTLVIHTDHLNARTAIDEESLSHGPKLQVDERINKYTDKYGAVWLRDLITVDDPDYFTRPWTTQRTYAWRGDLKVSEYSCEENNRNAAVNGITVAK